MDLQAVLLEIGANRLPGFEKIDSLFKQLKNTKDQSSAIKVAISMADQLSKIFSIPFTIDIHHGGSFLNNCGIIPKLKDSNLKSPIKSEQKIDLSPLFKEATIIIGRDFIDSHEPRQLTGVVLHEIGHLVNYLTGFEATLRSSSYKLTAALNGLNTIPFLNLIALPLLIITSRTLTYTSHIGEYNADRLAVEYGYGDELITLSSSEHKKNIDEKPNRKVWSRIAMLRDIVLGNSHPSHDDRVRKMLELIKTSYADKYKSKKLKKILDEYYPPEE